MSFLERKFLTVDGVELHGRLYPASRPGPGVVMCSAFNSTMDMLNFPDCAAALQKSNITTLIFNPRGIASSGGHLRNDIDPPVFVADVSDALSHLLDYEMVKPDQVGLVGLSFGGTVSVTAATVDPRCRFVVAINPLTDLDFVSLVQRARVLRKCMKDRESQVMGNPAFILPMVNGKGENPVGFGHGYDRDRYASLVRNNRDLAPGHANRLTLMTYYKLSMWMPWGLWRLLGSMASPAVGKNGVMFVTSQADTMSSLEAQTRIFNEIPEEENFQKRQMILPNTQHEDALNDVNRDAVVANMVKFIRSTLDLNG